MRGTGTQWSAGPARSAASARPAKPSRIVTAAGGRRRPIPRPAGLRRPPRAGTIPHGAGSRRSRRRRAPGRSGTGRCGRRCRAPAGRQRSRRRRDGPVLHGGGGAQVRKPGCLEAREVRADGGAEGLVVGDAIRVAVDEGDQGIGPLVANEVFDRRHALGIGQVELVGRGRELPTQGLERHQPPARGSRLRGAAIGGCVPRGEVLGDALVEPARREVVRVADGGVEDEMGQLMGNDDPDPGVRDVVRPDQREHRPVVRVSLATDVLPGARAQRVVERLLLGIHVEVDGRRLRDAQERGCVPDRLLADRECLAPERVATLVPVQAHEIPFERPPVEPRVRVDDAHGRSDHRRQGPVLRHQPPTGGDGSVGHQVPVIGERPVECQVLGPGGRGAGGLRDKRPDALREGEQHLHAGQGDGAVERLGERDPRAERRRGGRRLERGGGRGNAAGQHPEDQERGGRDAQDAAHCPSHARPARRRIPRPLVVAPRRPSRARAADVP